MTLPIYWDLNDNTVQIGTIVAYSEGWVESHTSDLYDFMGQVVAFHDESGEMGVLEITDTSGEWTDWHPNYAIPVQWVSNLRKFIAI